MSINAMVLGGLAAVLFFAVTWFACLFAGERELARPAASEFFSVTQRALATATWPGFSLDIKDGGFTPKSGESSGTHRDDKHVFEPLTEFFTSRAAAIAAEKDLSAEAKKEASNSVFRMFSRFRWIFAVQILTFFALLSTFGVAICRIIALRIARDEYCSIGDAWNYAWRVRMTGFLFPIAVALPVFFLAACNAVAGLFSQIPYLGWMLGWLPLPLMIVSSILILLIALGGLLSVGLVPAAIAVERKGTYDSLGKAFNYVFARPLPLVLYLLMLQVFLGILHALLLENDLVETVLRATVSPFWSNETYEHIVLGETSRLSGFQFFCGMLHAFVLVVYRLLVWGALISYALGAATSMFLIFRKDVDGLDDSDLARDPATASPTPPPAPPSA